jgi:hypothetical protein
VIAAVYREEIAGSWRCEAHLPPSRPGCVDCARSTPGQYDCAACAASDDEWRARGRCVGARPDGGVAALRVDVRDLRAGALVTTAREYPARFETCPRALLRPDLLPDRGALAQLVAQATAAEIDRRWPDIPAKLWSLIQTQRRAQVSRLEAQREAEQEALRRG